jgi:glycine cleavage system H lipoate-binding protein
MLEYGSAVLFHFLFIPFWRYVQGPAKAPALATAPSRTRAARAAEWFLTPADRLFHRGHAWLKGGDDGLVTVGLDDFAAKLVGPLTRVSLPLVGASVGQGEQAWRLTAADGRSVDMLSPVDGTVVELNAAVAGSPDLAERDPPGRLAEGPPVEAAPPDQPDAGRVHRWMEEAAAPSRPCRARPRRLPRTAARRSPAYRAVDAEGWDRRRLRSC